MVNKKKLDIEKGKKVVGISGCRDYDFANKDNIMAVMEKIWTKSDVILFGGALGIDTDTLTICGLFNESVDDDSEKVELVVVCPDTVDKQPWKAQQAIKAYATQVIELENPIGVFNGYKSFNERNKFIVENSQMLVAFWNGNSTGTKQAIDHAKENGYPHTVVKLT